MRRENFATFRLQDFRDQPDADVCTIHFLSGRTKALVLSCLKYAEFFDTRWFVDDENFIGVFSGIELDELESITDEAHAEIIMGCNAQDLIKTQRMLVAAITGETVDLDADLPTGVVDYSAVGLSPKFEGANGNITIAVEALETALENIETAIQSAVPEDLEDDLANVWTILQAISLALGGTVPAPLPPL